MDIYDSTDWTEMDLEDLKAEIEAGHSIEELLNSFVGPIASKRSSARRANWGSYDDRSAGCACRKAKRAASSPST
jgi:hypothetical protein